jgi:hypothetical protein
MCSEDLGFIDERTRCNLCTIASLEMHMPAATPLRTQDVEIS